MRFLARLFGRADTEHVARPDHVQQDAVNDETEENRATADDPIRFAEFIREGVLTLRNPDIDLELCPSEEDCERLKITPEQREACRREFVLMRGLGACMFVGRNLSPVYYQSFKREVCAALAQIQYGVPTEARVEEVSSAIDRYVEELGNETATGFSLTYLERVYSGNPHIEALFLATVFLPAFKLAMTSFEAARHGFCILKSGTTFEVLEALHGEEDKQQDESGVDE